MVEGEADWFCSLDAGFYPALEAGKIKPGMVVIFRYQGPKGAPGMPEMLGPTGALAGAGLLGYVLYPISCLTTHTLS